ncbi:MAG: hypothetical protein J6W36_00720 [Clostridiales bacterium]|nr:hypothetical protein [Clostridiales bacterium]
MDEPEKKPVIKEEEKQEEKAAVNPEPAASGAIPVPPVQNTAEPVPAPKKKKGIAGKVVCLAICCTLTGAALGAGGVIAFNAFGGRHYGFGMFKRAMYKNVRRIDDGSEGRRNSGRRDNDGNSDNRQSTGRNGRDRNSSKNYQNDKGNRGQNGTNRWGQGRHGNNRQNQPYQPGNGTGNQTPDNQAPNTQTPDNQTPAATPAPSDNNATANG